MSRKANRNNNRAGGNNQNGQVNAIVQNQVNNQPAPLAAQNNAQPKKSRKFDGTSMISVSEKIIFGPEALTYLKDKLSYMDPKKIEFSQQVNHPHGYGAFVRKNTHQMIMSLIGENNPLTIFQAGGHAVRDSKWPHIGTSYPVINVDDVIRHNNWSKSLSESTQTVIRTNGNSIAKDPNFKVNRPNACDCITKYSHGVCGCKTPLREMNGAVLPKDIVLSVDSIYYPGVLSGILKEIHKSQGIAYLAFHDYAKAIDRKQMEFSTWDGESRGTFDLVSGRKWHRIPNVTGSTSLREQFDDVGYIMGMNHEPDDIPTGPNYLADQLHFSGAVYKDLEVPRTKQFYRVKVTTEGNEYGYEHLVLNTHGKCWQYCLVDIVNGQREECFFTATVIHEYDMRGYPYVLVKVVATGHISNDRLTKCTFKPGDYYKSALAEVPQPRENFHKIPTRYWTSMQKSLKHENGNGNEVTVTFLEKAGLCRLIPLRLKTRIPYIEKAMEFNFMKLDLSASSRSLKCLVDEFIKANGSDTDGDELLYLTNAVRIVYRYTASSVTPLGVDLATSKPLVIAKEVMGGNVSNALWKPPSANLVKTMMFFLTLVYSMYWAGKRFGALADDQPILSSYDIFLPLQTFIYLSLVIWLHQFGLGVLGLLALVPLARADDGLEQSTCTFILGLIWLLCGWVLFVYKPRNPQRKLVSCGVTDPTRLADPTGWQLKSVKFKGRWKFLSTITNPLKRLKAVQQKEEKVQKIKGYQIAPIFQPIGKTYLPTIKATGTECNIAAMFRGASNQVEPDPEMMKEFEQFFKTVFYQKLLKNMRDKSCLPEYDWDEWLSHYPLNYQKKMKIARDNFILNGWTKEDEYYDSFPKVEKQVTPVDLNLTEDNEYIYPNSEKSNDVKERLINGPSATVKVVGNPVIRSFEKLFAKCVENVSGPKNFGEISELVYSKYTSFKDPLTACGDGSGFDMTQHIGMLLLQNWLFMQLYDLTLNLPLWFTRQDFMKVLTRALKPKMRMRGLLEMQVEGTRMSGDGWTFLGNSILSWAYQEFICYRANIRAFPFVKGDDLLVIMSKHDQPAYDRQLRMVYAPNKDKQKYGLGQICKFVQYGPLTGAPFLSCYFIETVNSCYLIRDPVRVFQLLSFTTNMDPNRSFVIQAHELSRANGICMLDWAHGLPIFESLANMLIRLGGDVAENKADWNPWADAYRVQGRGEYDAAALMDFLYDKYGITPIHVREFQQAVDGVTDIFCIERTELLNRLYAE